MRLIVALVAVLICLGSASPALALPNPICNTTGIPPYTERVCTP